MKTSKTEHARFFGICTFHGTARSLALLVLVTCAASIAAHADVGGVPKDVADLQAAVAAVQTQVVTLQTVNTTHASDVAALQTRVANLESANTALRNAVLALQAKDASQDAALTALQAKDSAHDAALTSLQAEFDQIVNPESFQASAGFVGIPSDTADHLVVKLDLPAGNYAVIVKGTFGATTEEVQAVFKLSTPGVAVWDQSFLNQDEHGIDGLTTEYGNVSLLSNVGLPTGGTINVTCSTGDDGFLVHSSRIIAIKVGSLH